MKEKTVKVAVIQATPRMFDTPGTIKKACELIEKAAGNGVKLMLFPEAFIGGYPKGMHLGVRVGIRTPEGRKDFRRYYENAICIPGPETDALAARAARCDLVFSQPLFSYGACNTASLRPLLGGRLVTFSAPNFEAYFPDVLNVPGGGAEERFPPPLEWHSRVIVQCRAAGLPLEEVTEVYVNHVLFRAPAVRRALERTWEKYARREQDVALGTLDMARREYAREAL